MDNQTSDFMTRLRERVATAQAKHDERLEKILEQPQESKRKPKLIESPSWIEASPIIAPPKPASPDVDLLRSNQAKVKTFTKRR